MPRMIRPEQQKRHYYKDRHHIQNYSTRYLTNDGDDFDRRENEFGLAVCARTEEIDEDDDSQTNDDPSRVQVRI